MDDAIVVWMISAWDTVEIAERLRSHFGHGPTNLGEHALRARSLAAQREGNRARKIDPQPGHVRLLARRPLDGRGRRPIDTVVADVGDDSDHLLPGSVIAYVDAFPYGTLDGIPRLACKALRYQGHVPLLANLRPIEIAPGEQRRPECLKQSG